MKHRLKIVLILLPVFLTTAMLSTCIHQLKKIPVCDIGRGINIANALEAPNEGDWGVVIEDGFFAVISAAGFDCVRIPIKWSAHTLTDSPYTIDEAFFSRIDHVVYKALDSGLKVVINIHHYDEMMENPDGHLSRFESIWEQISRRYSNVKENLYFELLNEPHGNLTPDKWNTAMNSAITVIRDSYAERKIIITGAEWGNSYSLEKLDIRVPKENLIASVHIYTPPLFTKQGAPWMGEVYSTLGVEWPGPPEIPIVPVQAAAEDEAAFAWFEEYNSKPYDENPAGPKPITDELRRAYVWSLLTGIPVLVGEFGTYESAGMDYRRNWTTFLRREIETRGFSWIYWDFAAGFAAYDTVKGEWIPQILESLIPN